MLRRVLANPPKNIKPEKEMAERVIIDGSEDDDDESEVSVCVLHVHSIRHRQHMMTDGMHTRHGRRLSG